ncbi:MAG: hypothetical protein AVDCRST_MAG01-01-3159 [uncultured Rubrobacteraceae bacterium]|uniref:Uncharacterized protein n=1 Tax=uncultured Rubrobacteraceae bacterium TaxID=349277 RepID=A0A6J4QCN7_9ACTN|nr:MAG: hypothetical protein AVDCRST_MAG01-01-3159 [uncultured Rubrobacteraceae bacterium]
MRDGENKNKRQGSRAASFSRRESTRETFIEFFGGCVSASGGR